MHVRLKDAHLGLRAGIPKVQQYQKAIELSLRKRIGSVEIHRVLRSQHQERLLDGESRATDRHLTFLHHFEQGRLDLGRCAVDFVGQYEVRKDRALLDAECPVLRIEYLRADHVCGQHIGRELNS